MRTTATLFSGFEGVGIGAINAGLTHLWGVEYDADIAAVAETNGFKTIVADVRAVDYATLERPWHLHASPVCKNASTAKVNGEESTDDLDTAAAVERAIEALRPTLFTLENVRGYLDFTAFKNIMRTLRRLGYQIAHDVLNSANFGVPQTRERLIVVARNDGKRPRMPIATHARADKLGALFEDRAPWVSWLDAAHDVAMSAPVINLLPCQIDRLSRAKGIKGNVLVDLSNAIRPPTVIKQTAPCATVVASWGRRPSTTPLFHYNGAWKTIPAQGFARFQSFPDSYKLPDSARLATTGIGNAVPPLLMQRVMEAQG